MGCGRWDRRPSMRAIGAGRLSEKQGWSTVAVTHAKMLTRLRMINRMLHLTAATGVGAAQFNALANTAIKIVNRATDRANDQTLESYAAESQCTTLVIIALQTYQTEADPTSRVAQWATRAIDASRTLIIPPTVSTKQQEGLPSAPKRAPTNKRVTVSGTTTAGNALPPRTPRATNSRSASATASQSRGRIANSAPTTPKIRRDFSEPMPQPQDAGPAPSTFDDLPRLAHLMSALASLLGVLGLTFRKIDCLKVLRALLRDQPDLVKEYVSSSVELASEYVKLGKTSRADSVFVQAIKISGSGQVALQAEIKAEMRVRYAHHLALSCRADEA